MLKLLRLRRLKDVTWITAVNPGLPLWPRSLRSERRALLVMTHTRPRRFGQTRRWCAWGGRRRRVNPRRWPRPRAASATGPPSWRRPAGGTSILWGAAARRGGGDLLLYKYSCWEELSVGGRRLQVLLSTSTKQTWEKVPQRQTKT